MNLNAIACNTFQPNVTADLQRVRRQEQVAGTQFRWIADEFDRQRKRSHYVPPSEFAQLCRV